MYISTQCCNVFWDQIGKRNVCLSLPFKYMHAYHIMSRIFNELAH